jgi:hypothetical protein
LEGLAENPDPGERPDQEDAFRTIPASESPPTPIAPIPSLLSGPVTFGENFPKKVRKHIDQVRHRGPVREAIPSPAKGGVERVAQIVRDRVAKGRGRATTHAGEAAVAYEDGGVTYVLRPGGEFSTLLGN